MSTESETRPDGHSMSILTGNTYSDDHLTLFDRTSASFVKRDTRYFKLVPTENKKFKRGYMEFCTGSSYIGEWNAFGFCGQGTYIYPHGVEYEGRFNKRGQFHGLGTLTYPNGQKMHGVWKNGKLFEYAYMFNCGEELDENFTYCKMPDRRFHIEIKKYFGPSGQEYLTADQPTKELPMGCFDTVDGIYFPQYKFIMSNDAYYSDIRIPTEEKIKWIKQYCRKAWDEPTGYRADLYENWNTGRRNDSKYYASTDFVPLSRVLSEHEEAKPPSAPKLYSFILKVKKPLVGTFSVFGMNRFRN